MLFYGVVSAQTEKVVDFFLEREAAEAMIGEVREDEPLLAEDLRSSRSSSARRPFSDTRESFRVDRDLKE